MGFDCKVKYERYKLTRILQSLLVSSIEHDATDQAKNIKMKKEKKKYRNPEGKQIETLTNPTDAKELSQKTLHDIH